MPQFTLRLTWTPQGADPHHPVPVPARRNKARAVANRNHVTINSITDETDGATWNVDGQVADVRNMISTWVAHGNVNVSGGP